MAIVARWYLLGSFLMIFTVCMVIWFVINRVWWLDPYGCYENVTGRREGSETWHRRHADMWCVVFKT